MNRSLRSIATWSMLAVLLSNSGCNAKEMPDSRRDYLLAHDHGWIDLVVKAPAGAPAYKPGEACTVGLTINGDMLLFENANLAGMPVGFRFVAPAGKLDAALHLHGCVKEELVLKLPLQLTKDHLVELAFDGAALTAGTATPFEPTSLEWVRTEMLRMQANAHAGDAATGKLTTLATASVALNAFGLLALLCYAWIRRRR
ncbi:hypothetical protein INH39_31305 [Massilia violaceinigra]|uniref:Uncharacterized protein n=1 Tax=Massilia violaceinigra TaxID=2045208 RepID=A0ABY4A4U6_9BURK|nr:hypothetical protein [Massilia violaceinigra]UOD29809.1 hypothetical protein INH39_31305 [Massilia violaceinigra]